jgi:HAD superfamily hydrolase (TIGR01509 family)
MASAVILFDLGGVLLPFDQERRVRAVSKTLAIDEAAARAALSPDLFLRLDLGDADDHDFAEAFSRAAGRPVTPAEARVLILSVFLAPDAALWALAARLQARAVVGGFSDNPAYVCDLFPPGARLDPMFWSSELRAAKSSDTAFAAVEARLGQPPGDILFVDDSIANVERARWRGWDAVHFTGSAALIASFAQRGLA